MAESSEIESTDSEFPSCGWVSGSPRTSPWNFCVISSYFFFLYASHARGKMSDDSTSPYLHDNAKYVHRKPAFDKMAYSNEVVIVFVCVSSSKSPPLLEIVKQNAKSALVANNAVFFSWWDSMISWHFFILSHTARLCYSSSTSRSSISETFLS